MKKTLIIDSPQRQALAIQLIQGLTLEEVHEMRLRPHKLNRSASQQGLQWMWNTDIGGFTGSTKNETHDEMKLLYCVPILCRDDEGYREMWLSLDALPETVREQIVNITSTTRLNVAQMAEYLTDMERHAAKFRIPLRHPDDYKYAMGHKKEKK